MQVVSGRVVGRGRVVLCMHVKRLLRSILAPLIAKGNCRWMTLLPSTTMFSGLDRVNIRQHASLMFIAGRFKLGKQSAV